MSKILLVYDDFAELNATELSLKKCNFDVIGLTNEYTIKDQVVTFNPDILVGFGQSQRVSSLSIGKKLKEMNRWAGKSVLLFPKGYDLPADDLLRMRMDMLLESPISVIRLIQIICKLMKLDEKAILEKLVKSFAKDRTDSLAFSSYDKDTVKAIQLIQGELEKLNTEKLESNFVDPAITELEKASQDKIAKAKNEQAGATPENAVTEKSTTDKPLETKKSFFEKDETPPPAEAGDPFAALISELKGETPKPVDSVTPEASKGTGAAAPNKTATATEGVGTVVNTAADDAPVDLEAVGQQISKDIAQRVSGLAEKVKKYTQLSAEEHIYPESMVKKVKAKKALSAMKKDWNPKDLESLDETRREFVTKLFDPKKDKK
jgi:hypothetical protein